MEKSMSHKTSHDDDDLDFIKLEKEVQMDCMNDIRYWQQNDAKIRAVEQRVPTYDDFREMVLAAHLKPLEKSDKISSMSKFTQVWNQAAQKHPKTISADGRAEQRKTQMNEKAEIRIPTSSQEFAQCWRRCKTTEDKKQLLFMIGASQLADLFRTEISVGLLGEFLECLSPVQNSEGTVIADILAAFTKSQRFSLSLAFLTHKEKDICHCLFQKLKSLTTTEDLNHLVKNVTELEKMYGVQGL